MADRFLLATRKGLLDYTRNPQGQWGVARRAFLGEPVTATARHPGDGSLYAALNLGHFGVKLHRSDDDGASWQEVQVPSYAGLEDDGDKPSLQLIWVMEFDAAGTLWAGTIPGGLFKSDDRGESWALVESLWNDPLRKQWFGGGADAPGIHSICFDPRDQQRIALGVSCGGIWLSDDGGDSWRVSCKGMRADYMPPDQAENPATQDPHRLVQCRDQPDTFWVQHHCGIFRSSDHCATWQAIQARPSSFGFAVAVHPANGERAWFVPAIKDDKRYPVDTKLVVSRTDDGGAHFDVLDTGLPQEASYDLIYRHALDVDSRGQCLAMASTTGGLWLSEDGGDSWQALSAHLAPVYALRFIG